jgi:hypothetical protein
LYWLIEVKKTSEVRLECEVTAVHWWVKVGESEQVKRQLKGIPIALDMKFCQMQSCSSGNFRWIMDFGYLYV